MESRGRTETEIEIYDTTQPADSLTGERPVKARVRQRQGDERRSRAQVDSTTGGTMEATEEDVQTYEGGTLEDVTVTAIKESGVWEHMKCGVAWATAIMIPAAAGWIVYKLKKRKKR